MPSDAETSPIPPHRPAVREPTVLLEDLTAGLLWPHLLRAVPLSLRPSRVGLGLAAVLLIALIGSLSTLWSDRQALGTDIGNMVGLGTAEVVTGLVTLEADHVAAGTNLLFFEGPRRLIEERWPSLILLGIPMAVVWLLGGTAISRSAALEFGPATVIAWTRALAFALGKWASAVGVALIPAIAVAAIVLGLALGGLILLGIPVVHVLGGLVYGLALLLGLGAVLLIVASILGWPMLVPALACEGTDALDAVQRAFAYVFGRPLRLVLYAVILLVQGWIALVVIRLIADATIAFTAWATSLWLGDTGEAIVHAAPDLPGTAAAAGWLVRLWIALIALLIAAWAMSYVFTAGTLLYLLCRRVNDGQDIREVA